MNRLSHICSEQKLSLPQIFHNDSKIIVSFIEIVHWLDVFKIIRYIFIVCWEVLFGRESELNVDILRHFMGKDLYFIVYTFVLVDTIEFVRHSSTKMYHLSVIAYV